MNQKEKIKEFIWSFINPNEEDCGWVEFNEENTKDLQGKGYEFDEDSLTHNGKYIDSELDAVMHLVEQEFGIKMKLKCVGSYTSCGYDMFCYAWACIMPNGELYFDSVVKESY